MGSLPGHAKIGKDMPSFLQRIQQLNDEHAARNEAEEKAVNAKARALAKAAPLTVRIANRLVMRLEHHIDRWIARINKEPT